MKLEDQVNIIELWSVIIPNTIKEFNIISSYSLSMDANFSLHVGC